MSRTQSMPTRESSVGDKPQGPPVDLEQFKQLLAGWLGSSAGAGASTELILAGLEPSLARCFRLCAIPHQFDRTILRVLLPEAAEEQAGEWVNSLSRLALVAVRGEELALHTTARSYLFGQWLARNDQEFRGANARLKAHFDVRASDSAGQAQADLWNQRMFHWIGADQDAGMGEFQRLCRQYRKAARMSDCATVIALAHEYDRVLTRPSHALLAYHEAKLAADRNDWDSAVQQLRQVLDNDEVSRELRMKAYNRLGLVYLAQRHWDDAIGALKSAEALAQLDENRRELPLILHDQSVAYRNKGDRDKAQRLLEQSIKLAETQNDLLCLARDHNSLGTLHRSFKEYPEAIASYEKGIQYLDQAGDRLRRAALYNNLGDVYSDLSNWDKSQQYFEASLQISKEAADTIGQAKALTNLVRVYRANGRMEDATNAGQMAANYFLALRDNYDAAVTILRLARGYASEKRKEAAIEEYGRAIELFQKASETKEAAAAEKERAALVHPPGLPWWAWAGIAVAALLVIVVLFAVIDLAVK
jgi:tetratricopeptide (TPR) repeat protein